MFNYCSTFTNTPARIIHTYSTSTYRITKINSK